MVSQSNHALVSFLTSFLSCVAKEDESFALSKVISDPDVLVKAPKKGSIRPQRTMMSSTVWS
jgi:hypothetical protein